jgi:cation:H+ antiporter
MSNVVILFALVVLFVLLGKSADVVIDNIQRIGKKLGVHVFFLGLMLGIMTTLPEFAVGINALINDVTEISVGNLLGGILVLLGLILGLGVVLNQGMKTDGDIKRILPTLLYLLLPVLFGLNGTIGFVEGLVIVIGYFAVIGYLYKKTGMRAGRVLQWTDGTRITKEIFFAFAGIVGVIMMSNLIVRLTMTLLERFALPAFVVGLLIFSIGTNLPELVVTIRSWKNNIKDLSLSNLLGSSMANVGLLGTLGIIRTLDIPVDGSFIFVAASFVLLLIMLLVFYATGKRLSRLEGFALIAFYATFVILQAKFLIEHSLIQL